MTFLPSNPYSHREEIVKNENIDINQSPDLLLNTAIPWDSNKAYDVRTIIKRLLDDNDYFELMPSFAQNISIGFGKMSNQSIGIIANNPLVSSGVLDISASMKAARFVRFCDAFNIPILTLVDVPGFLPGVSQEHNGIIKHGAKLLYAYAEATVPKLTVILRKAYGGAYDVMSSRHLRGDVNLAWPTAEVAVMGAQSAIDVLYRNESIQEKNIKLQEYIDKFTNPLTAAERGYLDDIIEPSLTRSRLISELRLLRNKNDSLVPKRKHGNIPL